MGATLGSSVFYASIAQSKSARVARACVLVIGALLATPTVRAAEPFSLFGPAFADTPETVFRALPGDQPPADFAALGSWVEAHTSLSKVDMLGGSYWLLTRFQHDQPISAWSVSLANTWYRDATVTILGDNGSRQVFPLDRGQSHSLLAYYGVEAKLLPGHEYAILIEVTTPFFTSLPRIDVQPMAEYYRRQANETVLTLGTLGLLTGLGIFVLFFGLWIRERSYLLYGVQSLILVLGWGFYFGVPGAWLGVDIRLINFSVWFILLSIVNAFFTITFLELRHYAPKLLRCGQGIALLAVPALALALIFPSYAHWLASFQVTLVVTFSFCSGLWALGRGVRQARFFTLAFLGVLLPGIVILPGNFGLTRDIIDNSDLLTLLGSGCEAMLLTLALADNVKRLTEAREHFRIGMQEAVTQASKDPLTGIGNRLAFNSVVEELTSRRNEERRRGTVQIAMIDLDGLKQVNDHQGHERGDALLRATGAGLAKLVSKDTQAFRIGGDEFAVIAYGDDLSRQRLVKTLSQLDCDLRAGGFPGAGISFGLRSSTAVGRRRLSSAELAELVCEADRAMYRQKAQRREARADSQWSG